MFAPVVFGHLRRVVRLHETVAATGIWTAAAIAAGPPEVGFLSNAVPIALALYYLILPLFTQFSRGA
jgi:hypothetical protein